MRKAILLLLLAFGISLSIFAVTARADELDDLGKQINDLKKSLDDSRKSTANNEKNLNDINTQLANIKARVNAVETEISKKEKEIQKGEAELAEQKEILDIHIVSYYKQAGKSSDALLEVVVSENISQSLQHFFYQRSLLDEDRRQILRIVSRVKEIEDKKIVLQKEKTRLEPIKVEIAKQSDFLAGEVSKAKKFENELQSKIASLSQRQQQIVAQKLGSLNLPASLGSGPLSCVDDRKIDPGFGNAFAFYTFGIPHRIGMSQYGADGRARAGQSHEDILRAYFDNFSFETRSARVKVQGFGEMDLEEYMLGIYEMPNSFHIEALKAQVIAARSYALSYTNNGEKEICTTQSCQVYKGGNKGGAWEQAVKETAGKVMVNGGQPITAWYASTAGGYIFANNDVWGGSQRPWSKRLQDTTSSVGSINELFERAYDKHSPCFYSAQGSRAEYNKSAWLKSEEVADIVNVLLLAKRDSSVQNHLSQPDRSNPDGVETWDRNKVKSELQNRGGSPLNSVSSVSMSMDLGGGRTTSVTISGDTGTHTFDANEFKSFFNLRAPANIQIVGPLYNAERK